jgi:hypothetical protein
MAGIDAQSRQERAQQFQDAQDSYNVAKSMTDQGGLVYAASQLIKAFAKWLGIEAATPGSGLALSHSAPVKCPHGQTIAHRVIRRCLSCDITR